MDELEEFKKTIETNPITIDAAKAILYSIDNNLSLKISDIILEDSRAAVCHWRCSVRNHGPIGVSMETFKEQFIDPLINPGNGTD